MPQSSSSGSCSGGASEPAGRERESEHERAFPSDVHMQYISTMQTHVYMIHVCRPTEVPSSHTQNPFLLKVIPCITWPFHHDQCMHSGTDIGIGDTTHMSYSDPSHKVNRSLWLQRLEGLKYFVLVTSQSHLYLGTRGKRCATEQRHVIEAKAVLLPLTRPGS